MPLPLDSPDQVAARLTPNALHHGLGSGDGAGTGSSPGSPANSSTPLPITLQGLSTRLPLTLSDAAWGGRLDNISPATSLGAFPIVIQGHAVRPDGTPLAATDLLLVIIHNGLERRIALVTGPDASSARKRSSVAASPSRCCTRTRAPGRYRVSSRSAAGRSLRQYSISPSPPASPRQ